MHPQQAVGLVQTCMLGCVACTLLPFQAPLHERATPSIRTGVSEHAERLLPLGWMLATRVRPEPRIELKASQRRMRQCSSIELELEDFASRTALRIQKAKPQRMRQPVPIGVDGDCRDQCLFFSEVPLASIKSTKVLALVKPLFSTHCPVLLRG